MNAFEDGFWGNIEKRADGCWVWLGFVAKSGYGLYLGTPTHRLSWLLTHAGPPGPSLCVCHKCDNRLCVNPDHLWLGTKGDNRRDCVAKGRSVNQNTAKTHCIRGHEFTPENTITTALQRICRSCLNSYQRRYQREWRATRKQEARNA